MIIMPLNHLNPNSVESSNNPLTIANISLDIEKTIRLTSKHHEDQSDNFELQNCSTNILIQDLVKQIDIWNDIDLHKPNLATEIKSTFIAIANYLDALFPSDEDIKNLTEKMLRQDSSRFYVSIKEYSGLVLKNLMNSFLNYISEISKIIEQSNISNRDDNLTDIKKALLIFPSSDEAERDPMNRLDFACLNGTINRIQIAFLSLKSLPLNIKIIQEVVTRYVTKFSLNVSSVSQIHIPKTVSSMLSLNFGDDQFFRLADNDIPIKDIFDLVINFKEKTANELDERISNCARRINQTLLNPDYSGRFEDLQKDLKNIYFEIDLEDLDFTKFFIENNPIGDDDSDENGLFFNPVRLKSHDEIKKILAQELKKKFPLIYQQENDLNQQSQNLSAFDYLAKLDIFITDDKIYFDLTKINNFLALFPLSSEIKSINDIEKIKAGLMILNILARKFKDNDSLFFVALFNKLKEKIPDLETYLTQIPVELKDQLKIDNVNDFVSYIHKQNQIYPNFNFIIDKYFKLDYSADFTSLSEDFFKKAVLFNHYDLLVYLAKNGNINATQKKIIIEYLLKNNCRDHSIYEKLLGDNQESYDVLNYFINSDADVNTLINKYFQNIKSNSTLSHKPLTQIAIEIFLENADSDRDIIEKKYAIISILIQRGISDNFLDPTTKKTLLKFAIKNFLENADSDLDIIEKKLAIISSLFNYNSKHEVKDTIGEYSLQTLIEDYLCNEQNNEVKRKIIQLIILLIKKNDDLKVIDSREIYILLSSAVVYSRNFELIQLLLNKGVDPKNLIETPRGFRKSVLEIAIMLNLKEIVEEILTKLTDKNKLNPDILFHSIDFFIKDDNKEGVIMRYEIIELLLKKIADPNDVFKAYIEVYLCTDNNYIQRNIGSQTRNKQVKIISLLLEHNANPETIIQYANKKFLELSIERYLEIEEIKDEILPIILLSIKKNADLSSLNTTLRKSFLEDLLGKKPEIINEILIKINNPSDFERKLLLRSVNENNYLEILKISIKNNLSEIVISLLINDRYVKIIQDQKNLQLLLNIAIENNKPEMVKILLNTNYNSDEIDRDIDKSLLQNALEKFCSTNSHEEKNDYYQIIQMLITKELNLYNTSQAPENQVRSHNDSMVSEVENHDNLQINLSPLDIILQKINSLENSQTTISTESEDKNKLFAIIELMIEKGFDIKKNYPQETDININKTLCVILKDKNPERAFKIYENFSSKIVKQESIKSEGGFSCIKSSDITEKKIFLDQDNNSLLYLGCFNNHVQIVKKILDEDYSPQQYKGLFTRIKSNKKFKVDDKTLQFLATSASQEIKQIFQDKEIIKPEQGHASTSPAHASASIALNKSRTYHI
jgi:hypothetical protein